LGISSRALNSELLGEPVAEGKAVLKIRFSFSEIIQSGLGIYIAVFRKLWDFDTSCNNFCHASVNKSNIHAAEVLGDLGILINVWLGKKSDLLNQVEAIGGACLSVSKGSCGKGFDIILDVLTAYLEESLQVVVEGELLAKSVIELFKSLSSHLSFIRAAFWNCRDDNSGLRLFWGRV
jgi:hypothetical protein